MKSSRNLLLLPHSATTSAAHHCHCSAATQAVVAMVGSSGGYGLFDLDIVQELQLIHSVTVPFGAHDCVVCI